MIYTINFSFDSFFGAPSIRIGINDVVLYNGAVTDTVAVEYTATPGSHELWVEHYGKKPHETTADHDKHVYIKSIFFDSINLDQLHYCPLTHQGKFYPIYEKSYIETCLDAGINLPEFIQPNHYLGHNGVWRLKFSSPENLWIIKEQNPSGVHLEDTVFSSNNNILSEIKDFFKL